MSSSLPPDSPGQGVAHVAVAPLPVRRAQVVRGPHYHVMVTGYGRGRGWRYPRPLDRGSTDAYAWMALREHRPRHALRITGLPRARSLAVAFPEARFDDPYGFLPLAADGRDEWVGLAGEAEPVEGIALEEMAVYRDGFLGTQLDLGRPLPPAEPPLGYVDTTPTAWSRFESVEHRVYVIPTRIAMPVWVEHPPGRVHQEENAREVRLDVYLADVGEAVEFDPEPNGWADSLVAEQEGAGLVDAFLALDLDPDRYLAADEEIAGFFETFGAPPELGDARDSYWSPGRRFISLKRIREVRAALPWRSADPTKRPDPALIEMSPAGTITVSETGEPVLEANLWELLAIEVMSLARQDHLGYCEASLPYSVLPCAKPFVRKRGDRGRFCSDTCRARAHWQRKHGHAPTVED